MAVETQILINNYGMSEEFATKLLDFTNADVEAAIEIVEASEKDIVVIKAKFLSNKKLLYGAIVLFYNFQTCIPEFVYCAVSRNVELSRIKLETEWVELISDMQKLMTTKEAEHDIAGRIESEILSDYNVSHIASFFIEKKTIDLVNIKRFLMNAVGKIFLDNKIAQKTISNFIDVFKFHNYITKHKIGLRLVSKTMDGLVMLINMKVEPILSPIGGIDIVSIKKGQEILVKITDNREIINIIGKYIDHFDETGSKKPVYGKIYKNKKSLESDNNFVTIEFGPGIYASIIVGNKIRVKVKEQAPKEIIVEKKIIINNVPGFDEIKYNAELEQQREETLKVNKKSSFKIFNIIIIALMIIAAIVLIIVFFT